MTIDQEASNQVSCLHNMTKKHKSKQDTFIPNEILGLIISEVTYGLINLALVSKRFKDLVWPILFRKVRMRAERRLDSHYSFMAWDKLPPGLVSETSRQPFKSHFGFCDLVQSLSLRVEDLNWYRPSGGHERLVRLLPSLKELSLNPPPKEYNFFMNRRLTTMRLTFPDKLEHFWGRQASNVFDPNEYLSKPTLRRLKLDGMHNNTIHTGSPESSAVTDLCLANWDPEGVSILISVLRSIRHLRHLALEVHGQWQVHRTRGPIHGVPQLHYGPLLEPHSGSLEALILSYSNEEYNDNSIHFPRIASPLIGTLTSFHSLKRLAIPEPFLVRHRDAAFHSLLPRQLEELQIQHPFGTSTDARQIDPARQSSYHLVRMERLAMNKEESVPRLKYLVWWFQQTPRQGSHAEETRWNFTYKYRLDAPVIYHNPTTDPIEGPTDYLFKLAEDFRKVGVKFEFVLTPSFHKTPFAEYL